jgi:glycosyltransferase involved in cell wall biosynthesis
MPRVSIGLPVYNGENFLRPAVESLLAQTFRDFVLVIVDNASTDATADICRNLAQEDARIRYRRNPQNVGSGPNLALTFELSPDSEFFLWAAHDDLHAPRFVEACVDALERDPSGVLAFTRVQFIDEEGNPCGTRERPAALGSGDALERYQALLPSYDCLEIFGVIRRSALTRRPVIGFHPDGDGVLLAALGLRGRFLEVPELLFQNRRHPGQATARLGKSPRQWAVEWNPGLAGRHAYPAWRRIWELWRGFLAAPQPARDRLRCGAALARWTRWRIPHLVEDLRHNLGSRGRPR